MCSRGRFRRCSVLFPSGHRDTRAGMPSLWRHVSRQGGRSETIRRGSKQVARRQDAESRRDHRRGRPCRRDPSRRCGWYFRTSDGGGGIRNPRREDIQVEYFLLRSDTGRQCGKEIGFPARKRERRLQEYEFVCHGEPHCHGQRKQSEQQEVFSDTARSGFRYGQTCGTTQILWYPHGLRILTQSHDDGKEGRMAGKGQSHKELTIGQAKPFGHQSPPLRTGIGMWASRYLSPKVITHFARKVEATGYR